MKYHIQYETIIGNSDIQGIHILFDPLQYVKELRFT